MAKSVCQLKACYNKYYSMGFCSKHYQRLVKYGNPLYMDAGQHRLSNTPEYLTWCNMRQRCENINKPEYRHYGGRGIKVCDRWQIFKYFLDDMGKRPSSLYSIDRINVDGDYEPSNCRWATRSLQRSNVRPTSNTGIKNIYKTPYGFIVSKNGKYGGSYRSAETAESALKERLE